MSSASLNQEENEAFTGMISVRKIYKCQRRKATSYIKGHFMMYSDWYYLFKYIRFDLIELLLIKAAGFGCRNRSEELWQILQNARWTHSSFPHHCTHCPSDGTLNPTWSFSLLYCSNVSFCRSTRKTCGSADARLDVSIRLLWESLRSFIRWLVTYCPRC